MDDQQSVPLDLDTIVYCPRCGNEKDHRRLTVSPYGDFLKVRCGNLACALIWKTAG